MATDIGNTNAAILPSPTFSSILPADPEALPSAAADFDDSLGPIGNQTTASLSWFRYASD